MEYAPNAWSMAAKANKTKLDKVQNLGLRCMLCAMRSSPIHEIKKIASIPLLETRREEKLLKQGGKLKQMKNHPLHAKLQAPTLKCLKRQSHNHLLKPCQRKNSEILATSPDFCVSHTRKEYSS